MTPEQALDWIGVGAIGGILLTSLYFIYRMIRYTFDQKC